MFLHQTHRPVTDFRGKFACVLAHGSILSRVRASSKPGALHYPKRWEEFIAQTSKPVSKRYEPASVIPDVALISFLVRFGEIPRALSVPQTIVDLTVEEFEIQPLMKPQWLDGGDT